jgi:hypothetical protein
LRKFALMTSNASLYVCVMAINQCQFWQVCVDINIHTSNNQHSRFICNELKGARNYQLVIAEIDVGYSNGLYQTHLPADIVLHRVRAK